MFFFLKRFWVRVIDAPWKVVLTLLLVLYVIGAYFMYYLEAGGKLSHLDDYSWWFLVTITTIGYGDIYPETNAGRLVAAVIMLLGIGSIGVVVAKIADTFFNLWRSSMKGKNQLYLENHIVIFGYRKGETECLVQEISADEADKKDEIVLCSSVVEENPIPERVKFVYGDLSSDDVLTRACAEKADRIVIHGHDDNQTVMVALAVCDVNDHAHTVAHITNPEYERHLQRLGRHIECVKSVTVPLMVQAMQDKGITKIYGNLLSNVDPVAMYRLDIPSDVESLTFGTMFARFKEVYDAIIVSVAETWESDAPIVLNPPLYHEISGGMSVFYVATERLVKVDWGQVSRKN